MINQLDLRRVLIFSVLLVIVWPWLVVRVLTLIIGGADRGFSRCWDVMHRWANPDLYGNAPARCRKLVYSRRTVERLASKIESLNRVVQRQEARQMPGQPDSAASPEQIAIDPQITVQEAASE